MLLLLFPNTLVEAQSVKDPQLSLEERGLVCIYVFFQTQLLFLLFMFFKHEHAPVHGSRETAQLTLWTLTASHPKPPDNNVTGDLVNAFLNTEISTQITHVHDWQNPCGLPVWRGGSFWYSSLKPTTDQYLHMQLE